MPNIDYQHSVFLCQNTQPAILFHYGTVFLKMGKKCRGIVFFGIGYCCQYMTSRQVSKVVVYFTQVFPTSVEAYSVIYTSISDKCRRPLCILHKYLRQVSKPIVYFTQVSPTSVEGCCVFYTSVPDKCRRLLCNLHKCSRQVSKPVV